ncbi:MAG TPA: GAP family protein [Methylomirabilota bacterium]|nr:GAP family protein [Methylomirabilota bacterium]
MDIAKILPLAIVMVTGPQILTAIFLATSKQWRKNSLAFILGGAIAVTTIATAAFLLRVGAQNHGVKNHDPDLIVLALIIAAAIHTFMTRKQSKPPKWMGKLEETKPKVAFKIGFLLMGFFPGDILTAIAVGGYISGHNEPWAHILPFIGLTLLLLAIPALLVIILGKRAETVLPKLRNWMNDHSWIVSEFVFGMFILILLSEILS